MSEIKKYTLVIDLKSDLICGSGQGWGSIIDTDVAYDALGFPYIPARRIRGLLKEAALELEMLGIFEAKTSEIIFGNEEVQGHHFVLHNAVLENIEELHNEVKKMSNKYMPYLTPLQILNHYTVTRTQTAIDDQGIAKKNCLRTVRSISRKNRFYATVECEQQDCKKIRQCLSMIHHMGVSRTRGFGEVDLSWKENKPPLNKVRKESFHLKLEDNVFYDVKLYLENKAQIIVNKTKGEKNLDYITGSSILGYFANQYLKTHSSDGDFYHLFLEGGLRFSNAYISDDQWHEYYPVRKSLFKSKTEDIYYDKISENPADILSKVKNKYISGHYLKEVRKEMVYHHRRPNDKSIGHVLENSEQGDGTFYQVEAISANQRFIATISGLGKDLKAGLNLTHRYIQIGKSKHTQYGNVYIHDVQIQKEKKKIIAKGNEVVVTLISPLLLLNEKRESQLEAAKLAALFHLENPTFFVGYTSIGGYHSKWQLQKPSYVAFSAGSCIRGRLTENIESNGTYGMLIQEGLGQVIVEPLSEKHLSLINDNALEEGTNVPKYTKEIVLDSMKHELMLTAMYAIDDLKVDATLNATLIGKLLLSLSSGDWEYYRASVKKISDSKKRKDVEKLNDAIEHLCDRLLEQSLLKELTDDYSHDFYHQTLEKYLIRQKIEGRKVK